MAHGSRLLSDHKAIVSRLSAIEQLAGVTVLCSDKTGLVQIQYHNLAVLVYRLVCQPVTLESWVRFPDAAA